MPKEAASASREKEKLYSATAAEISSNSAVNGENERTSLLSTKLMRIPSAANDKMMSDQSMMFQKSVK